MTRSVQARPQRQSSVSTFINDERTPIASGPTPRTPIASGPTPRTPIASGPVPEKPAPVPEKNPGPPVAAVLPPGAEVVLHRGRAAADKEYLRSVLQNMIVKEGTYGVVEFLATFRGTVLSKSYHLMSAEQLREFSKTPRFAADMERNRKARACLLLLEEVDREIHEENEEFLKKFEAQAKGVAGMALDEESASTSSPRPSVMGFATSTLRCPGMAIYRSVKHRQSGIQGWGHRHCC